MGVEVDQALCTHEGGPLGELLLGPGMPCDVLAVGEPCAQPVRDVLQEEHQAERGSADGLQPLTHGLRALPVLDGAVDAAELVGEPRRRGVRDDPPVVHQGEALEGVPENPVGGHGVGCQFAPGAESGRAETVLVEGGQVEEVGRRSGVLGLEVRQRDPLDEDLPSADVQLRRPAADAGAVCRGRGHEVGDPAVAQRRQPGGDGLVGGQTRGVLRMHVPSLPGSCGGRSRQGTRHEASPLVGSFVRYAGSLTAGPVAACSRVMWRRRVGRPSIGLATPQAALLQISSL